MLGRFKIQYFTFSDFFGKREIDCTNQRDTKAIHRCLAADRMVPCKYPLLKSRFLSTLLLDEQKRS